MKTRDINRRDFMKLAASSAGAMAAAPLLAPARVAAAATMTEAREALNDLRITEMKILRLQFPGHIPLMRNAIVESGGGPPTMNLLEIHTNQGIIGRSIPKGNRLISSAFSKIKGENPFFVERIWDLMYRYNRKPVAKGYYIKAMGSIDMAIWDIIGKALNMPVNKVLGAYHTKLRVYAAGGYYQKDKTISDLAKEMEGYVKEGFRAVKMKIGGESFAVDVKRVQAVRKAIGPDVDLLIDANNKWKAYEAIRFGLAVEKYNIFWFEEPVEPDDFAGCAEVRRELNIPIVAGENEFTRWGCRDLIEAKSADILNLDTVKAGGITEYRKIAALASAYHIPVAPHGNPFMAVHLIATTPNYLIMETYPGTKSQYNPVLPLFPVKDGYITVPDTPGLGIDPDPADIKRYLVD